MLSSQRATGWPHSEGYTRPLERTHGALEPAGPPASRPTLAAGHGPGQGDRPRVAERGALDERGVEAVAECRAAHVHRRGLAMRVGPERARGAGLARNAPSRGVGMVELGERPAPPQGERGDSPAARSWADGCADAEPTVTGPSGPYTSSGPTRSDPHRGPVPHHHRVRQQTGSIMVATSPLSNSAQGVTAVRQRAGSAVPDHRCGHGLGRTAHLLAARGPHRHPPALGPRSRRDAARGRRVADVGCGFGWSSIGIALAYPEAPVDAFDVDVPSVEAARRNAAEAGVAIAVLVVVTVLVVVMRRACDLDPASGRGRTRRDATQLAAAAFRRAGLRAFGAAGVTRSRRNCPV